MGTLGGDFWSSLPLHEYPPAFPSGLISKCMTWITTWGPGLPPPTPKTSSEPLLLFKAFWLFCKGLQSRELLSLCVVCDEVFRYEVDFNFSFLPGLDYFLSLTESQVSGPFSTSDL